MNTTQSIIVYRNPIEAHFWESGMAFPLIATMIFTVLAAVIVDAICDKFRIRKNTYPVVGATILAFCTSFYFFFV